MKSYFWFRRDLRLEDNVGLFHALKSGNEVQCLFIFDDNILRKLSDKADPRVHFIHDQLIRLNKELQNYGGFLEVRIGSPEQVWKEIIAESEVAAVYTNKDYEPYAKERDQLVKSLFKENDVNFEIYKDQVIFESLEISKSDGTPYTVYTPYKRRWLEKIGASREESDHLKSFHSEKYLKAIVQGNGPHLPSLEEIGFESTELEIPDNDVRSSIIKNYGRDRDFPGLEGTSKLGIHFRFGTISIREKARKSMGLSDVFLSELIWRDFYAQILDNFPFVSQRSFKEKYERIEWRNNEHEFKIWCEGRTGYPLVDAGMRELNSTGFMHNRVRMLTASFLTKHLLIDWRWGEQYFADKLLDFDLASNNGGWQWAAGCGTDAAPYFRIFNPTIQLKKFDKNLSYVKKWIPDFGTQSYPEPMVDHKVARERCLNRYKSALN